MICRECETVAHCTKHGCIPKVDRTIDMAHALSLARALALDDSGYRYEFSLENFEAYEALVRADERNELAKHFEQAKQAGIHTDWVAAAIRARGNT